MVANGYKVPFDEEPLDILAENNKSCLRNMPFVFQEIKRLEKWQCVKQVSGEDCKVIMPLSVVYSNNLRLGVDTSLHINLYVTKQKVKLDLLKEFTFLVENEDFVVVDDLDSGYWHLPLHPSQSSLFGVAIFDQEEKKTLYFLWKVLFLGVTDAVYIFT